MLPEEQQKVVFAEYDAFLERCEAQGIQRWEAQAELIFRSMASWQKQEVDAQTARPGYAELEAAYRQRDLATSDPVTWQKLCRAWLKAATGADIGDVVSASGWAQPRDILVKDVELSWSHPDTPLWDGWVVFVGPFYQKGSPFKADGQSLTYLKKCHHKVSMPAALERNCRERGLL